MDPSVALEERHEFFEAVLQALARAEDALNNSDVAEYFGEEAASQTVESISRALRNLHLTWQTVSSCIGRIEFSS